jgi:hypothetical protein
MDSYRAIYSGEVSRFPLKIQIGRKRRYDFNVLSVDEATCSKAVASFSGRHRLTRVSVLSVTIERYMLGSARCVEVSHYLGARDRTFR